MSRKVFTKGELENCSLFKSCFFFFSSQQAIGNYWVGQKFHLGYGKNSNKLFGQPNTASFKQCSDMGRFELQTTLEFCGD